MAVEWEAEGDAEHRAAASALHWLDQLPHDPLDCSPAEIDEVMRRLSQRRLGRLAPHAPHFALPLHMCADPGGGKQMSEMLTRLTLRLQRDTVAMCQANWLDFKHGLEHLQV